MWGERVQYYLQLKRDDFFEAMIPKERFLLGIVQSVNEEIEDRRLHGVDVSELGIREIIPPDEMVIDEYVREMQKVADLIDEIEQLERKARQKADLNALEILSGLKRSVREIIEGDASMNQYERIVESISTGENGGIVVTDSMDSFEVYIGPEDLFEQWKYNQILDYKVKYTEFEFLRTRLLQTATPAQEKRMFQRYLKRTLDTYSRGDFLLSRLQFRDILSTFEHYEFLDDICYYYGESCYGLNYFDEALEAYQRVIDEYPGSLFCAKALVKQIYIYYIYGQLDRLYKVYQHLLIYQDQLDSEQLGIVFYLVGYAYFQSGEYEKAIESLGQVASGTTYFFPSLYLSAACCSNLGRDEAALTTYQMIVEERIHGDRDPVLSQIKNNALLKLGLIYYERGEDEKAVGYFNQVSQDFQYYDLSLMAKAWSAYRTGRPGEVLESVDWLLNNAMISNYAYEAMVLAASSKDLLGNREEAIEDLKQVYRIGSESNQNIIESSDPWALVQDLRETEEVYQESLDDKDRAMFAEIDKIRQFLQASVSIPQPADYDETRIDDGISETTEEIIQKIETLDNLEKQLENRENTELIRQIRQLRSSLIEVLQGQTDRFSGTLYDAEESPLIRRMGIAEYQKYIFRSLLLQTKREKDQTMKDILEAEQLLEEAREQDRFEIVIQMEIHREELEDYYGKLNLYEVWLLENMPQDFQMELDRWASFSGYGISNINFSRIKENEQRIAQISQTIQLLDHVFQSKRKNLDDRIESLLNDVAKIEEQMQEESVRKEQEERDQFFQIEYFNREEQESVVGEIRETTDSEEP
ncbi:tetratricopeptide repeat protein [bacterium]|nr:tetratricopeptide repeat protein [bacterium]